MTRAEEYLVRAAECEKLAEQFADKPRLNKGYMDLARLWRVMALEEAEREQRQII